MLPISESLGKAPSSVSVGVIANPISGSDIRRLVAMGSVYGTQEKINIIQRVLVGLATMGVQQVHLMPDANRICQVALDRLPPEMSAFSQGVKIIDMPMDNSGDDSTYAAQKMAEMGVGCIVVLGGDGTSRVVAKGSGEVPILPISTGTNNVVPYSVEGTVAGLAAGYVARNPDRVPEVAYRSKWLMIQLDEGETDLALADVAVLDGMAVGSRAIWESESLQQAILTRAEPTTTGISSLGGFIQLVSPYEPAGLHVQFGNHGGSRLIAPLAPGLMSSFGIVSVNKLAIDEEVHIQGGGVLLALDGEREIILRRGQSARIQLRQDGPWIVDVFKALHVLAKDKTLYASQSGDGD